MGIQTNTQLILPVTNFNAMIRRQNMDGRFLCVGLDSALELIPQQVKSRVQGQIDEAMFEFNAHIVDLTADIAAAYKFQAACYLAQGEVGLSALVRSIEYITSNHPQIPVILDNKLADIGNTNNYYVQYVLNRCKPNAVTLNPFFGGESLKPFLDVRNLGAVILCRTSNPGAGEIQDQKVLKNHTEIEKLFGDRDAAERYATDLGWTSIPGTMNGAYGIPLYQVLAAQISKDWNRNDNCMLVVGATVPKQLSDVRRLLPSMPLLIPGVGKQGGDAATCAAAACDDQGLGFVINNSSQIITAENPRIPALQNHREIHTGVTRELLRRNNAVLKGHFVYTQGDHGPDYVDKDRVLVNPLHARMMATMIADDLRRKDPEVVVGPATAGAILGELVALRLTELTGKVVHFVRADKTGDGGFDIKLKDMVESRRTAVVEDILNTGGSAGKTVKAVHAAGGRVISVEAACNRGGVTKEDLGCEDLYALLEVRMPKMKPEECTLCHDDVPVNTEVGHGKTFLAKKAAAAATAATTHS